MHAPDQGKVARLNVVMSFCTWKTGGTSANVARNNELHYEVVNSVSKRLTVVTQTLSNFVTPCASRSFWPSPQRGLESSLSDELRLGSRSGEVTIVPKPTGTVVKKMKCRCLIITASPAADT